MPTELTLDFRNKQLTEFPAEIRLQPDVTHLNLSGNRISAIPEWIGELKNLVVLNMNVNALTDITPLTEVTSLVVLKLNVNKITRLPEEIVKWKNLHRLELIENRIDYLPESIGGLESLNRILLGNNQLQTLPDSIAMLDKLEVLNVFDNRITHLPQTIGALKMLNQLQAGFNQLEALPDVFNESQPLITLSVFKNRITKLPASLLQLKALKELNIGCNAIERLENLPEQIQELSIYDNPLKETAPETIRSLISKFDEIVRNSSYAFLFLDTNQIPDETTRKYFDETGLKNSNALKVVDIEKRYTNPFDVNHLPYELAQHWNITTAECVKEFKSRSGITGKE